MSASSVSARKPPRSADRPGRRRWTRHGWNTRTSLHLIRTIVPKLPTPILSVARWLTTSVCYAAMSHERTASLDNLRRICGEDGWRLRRRSFSLFHNFSRFMVERLDLGEVPGHRLEDQVVNLEEARANLSRNLQSERGAVVATAHLGNWEMGIQLLKLTGRTIHVLMKADGDLAIEEEYQRLRKASGVQVHWVGKDPYLSVELLSALRRGDILALQVDRDVGSSRVKIPLFGAPAWLPLGPASLARAAEVPILPCFVLMETGSRVRVRIHPPISVSRTEQREADLLKATQEIARSIETVVSERPEQWFNFYPMWDEECQPT